VTLFNYPVIGIIGLKTKAVLLTAYPINNDLTLLVGTGGVT